MDYIGGIIIVLIFLGIGFLFKGRKGSQRDNVYDDYDPDLDETNDIDMADDTYDDDGDFDD